MDDRNRRWRVSPPRVSRAGPHPEVRGPAGEERRHTGEVEQAGALGEVLVVVGEAFALLDAAGEPVGPLIAWYDERPRAELAWLTREVGRERLHALDARDQAAAVGGHLVGDEAAVVSVALFRRANFRIRYVRDGGHASTGWSVR